MKRKVAMFLIAALIGINGMEPPLAVSGARLQDVSASDAMAEEKFMEKEPVKEEFVKEEFTKEEFTKGASAGKIIIGTNGYEATRAGLQKAFDFIREQNEKGNKNTYTVEVPTGTYNIDSPLYLYSNTHLALASGAVMKNTGIGTCLLRLGRNGEVYSGFNGFQNITIEGGTWTAELRDGSSLLRMAHAKNVTIKNAVFQDVKNEHHIEVAGIDGFTVTGCTFSGYEKTIESDELLMEALEIDILGGEKYFPSYEAYDYTPMKNVTVTNNVFKNLFRGVGTHSLVRGSYFENIKIQDNKFENIADFAIIATNYQNSSIARNTLTNVGAGINFCYTQILARMVSPKPALKFNTDSQSRIEENTIILKPTDQATRRYAIRVDGDEGNYVVGNLTIHHNTINAAAGGHGIYGEYVSNCIVTSNTITGSNTLSKDYKGIRFLKASGGRISGNTVRNMSDIGIQVSDNSKNCLVEGNVSASNRGAGIAITKSDACTVKGNNASSNKGNGISLNGNSTTAAISGNIVEKNGKYGIYLTKGTGCIVTDNGKVSENGNHGIYFSECSNIQAARNRVISNKKSGIVLGSVSVGKVVSNLDISSNKENGITVNKCSDIEVSGNSKITGNKRMGVSVTGKSVKNILLSGNKISSSGIHGVTVSGESTAAISGNAINSNKKYGISISGKSANCNITGNTVNSNKKGGMLIAGKCINSKITKNTVKSNQGNGIAISSSNGAVITDNPAISRNGGHGILITGKSQSAEVSGNVVSLNKAHGINLYDKSVKARIFSNTVRKNAQNGISISGKSKASVLKKNILIGNKGLNIQIDKGCSAPVKNMDQLTVGSLNSKSTQIKGKAQKGAKIQVSAKGKTIGKGTVKKDETYTVKIKKQKKGTMVTVIMSDKQKNQVQKEIKVKK